MSENLEAADAKAGKKKDIATIVCVGAALCGLTVAVLAADASQKQEAEKQQTNFLNHSIQEQFESAKHGLVSFTCPDKATGGSYPERPQNFDDFREMIKKACRLNSLDPQ